MCHLFVLVFLYTQNSAFDSIKGEDGDPGQQGEKGAKGIRGKRVRIRDFLRSTEAYKAYIITEVHFHWVRAS